MSNCLVSVVMVVCNADRFLAEAIESVLCQTFRDFEFIIVDFGSTDNSKEIIANCAKRDVRILFREIPKCRLVDARNTACRLARGRYIAVMDADDVSIPNRLEWQVAFLEGHPKVGLLGGTAQWIDGHGCELGILEVPTEAQEIESTLLVRFPFCHPSIMLRREAFEHVGGYRSVFTVTHDYDLALRISEHFQCANLEQIVVRYRIHAHQVSLSKRKQQTLCKLAAQASALDRRKGQPDPLAGVEEITAELLERLGVSRATLESVVAQEYWQWVQHMQLAGEDSVALQAATEMLQATDLQYVARRLIADVRLTAAKLLWTQKRPLGSAIEIGRAVLTRPAVIGRPLKRFMRSVLAAPGQPGPVRQPDDRPPEATTQASSDPKLESSKLKSAGHRRIDAVL